MTLRQSMINQALRYQPVVRLLRAASPDRVLEVGSGPEGLAMFWHGPVLGVDVHFKRRPIHPSIAASAIALPFADHTWPVVVSCDMLEHIPAQGRTRAVAEMARVTSERLYLAFPSGPWAWEVYLRLAARLGRRAPAWLHEHLQLGLPDAHKVAIQLRALGMEVTLHWYEGAESHYRLALVENGPIRYATYALARVMGPLLVRLLPPVFLHQEQQGYLRAFIEARVPPSTGE